MNFNILSKCILIMIAFGINAQVFSSGDESIAQNQQAAIAATEEEAKKEAYAWKAFQNVCENKYTWDDFIPYLKQYLPADKQHLSAFNDIVKEIPKGEIKYDHPKTIELYLFSYLNQNLDNKIAQKIRNLLFEYDFSFIHLLNYIQKREDIKIWLAEKDSRLEKLARLLVNLHFDYTSLLNESTIDNLYTISGLKDNVKNAIILFLDNEYIDQIKIDSSKILKVDFLDEYLQLNKKYLTPMNVYKIIDSYLINMPHAHERIIKWISTLINDKSDWQDVKKNFASASDEAKEVGSFLNIFIHAYRNKMSAAEMRKIIFALKTNEAEHFVARHNPEKYKQLIIDCSHYLQNLERDIKVTADDYMKQHDNSQIRRVDRLDNLKPLRQYANQFPLEERRLQADLTTDFRKWNAQQVNAINETNVAYQLAKTKFSYANLLDFAGISKLKIKQPVKVHVSESYGVKGIASLKCENCMQSKQEDSHGAAVAGIIRSIAPNVNISGNTNMNTKQEINSHIVNLSWEILESSSITYIINHIKPRLEATHTLFVWATGNDSKSGMPPVTIMEKNILAKALYEELTKDVPYAEKQGVFEENLKHMLWVTAITGYSAPSVFATRPGVEFKDHSLSALGTDVMALNNQSRLNYQDGTSFAAPTVTGVAALLKEEYFDMTPFDIKTCLLESADKEIFPNYGDLPGEKLPNGKIRLDPTVYGKGILNAPHAMLYAKILRSMRQLNNPDLAANDPSVIAAYQREVAQEEAQAAQKINKLIRLKKNNP